MVETFSGVGLGLMETQEMMLRPATGDTEGEGKDDARVFLSGTGKDTSEKFPGKLLY